MTIWSEPIAAPHAERALVAAAVPFVHGVLSVRPAPAPKRGAIGTKASAAVMDQHALIAIGLASIVESPGADPMPRYFFNMVDGTRDEDDLGTMLADDRVAFREAVRFAGMALASEPQLLTDHMRFAVEVADERRELILVVNAVAELRHAAT